MTDLAKNVPKLHPLAVVAMASPAASLATSQALAVTVNQAAMADVPRGPRLGDAAFRAQRFALESAQDALRRLAAQAHGEVLTQLMHAWEKRDAAQLPAAQAIGNKLSPAQRTQWSQALTAQPQGEAVTPLLRLEVAADLPTPAAHMDARRALQLQMLTRRNDPSPQMTWAADAAQVLGGAYDEAAARRLQAALKVLLKR
jgi:ATP-dependent RNA helicase SUPV3L1/SUV3